MDRCRTILAGLLASAVAIPAAHAQDSDEQLGDIVVTARKSEESLTDVPLAITALSGEDVEQRGIVDIADVAAFTPGFRFQNQSVGRNDRGFKQFVIRGMVPNSPSPIRQSVTIFVDGAPVSGGNISGVTDIERIEIVRGPQSAFFGRATFAGAVNFITTPPSYDWGGNIVAQYERFNTWDLSGSVEGPIVADKLAFRLSGRAYHTDGGYEDSSNPGERLGRRSTQSVSLSLLAEPTETLRIRAFATRWTDSDGLPANARFGVPDYNCNAGGAAAGTLNYVCGELGAYPVRSRTWSQVAEPVAYQAVQNSSTRLYEPGFVDHLGLKREAVQLRLSADLELGDFQLSALGAYGQNKWGFLQTYFGEDLRNIPNPSYVPGRVPYAYSMVGGHSRDEDNYLELRLSSPQQRKLRALIGVNYLNADYDNANPGYGDIGAFVVTPRTLSVTDTVGIFGSITYEPTDYLTFSAEGRYQVDRQYQKTFAGAQPEFTERFHSFTPRLSVEFKPSSAATIYASYAEGNRPGAFNSAYYAQTPFVQQQIQAQANVEGVVPEDRLKMGEFGFKGQLFDNRVRILASAYYGKWTNRHVPSTILFYATPAAQAANSLSQIIVTAPNGEVDLKGIELEAMVRPTRGLTLEGTFNVAATDIRRTACTECGVLTGNANPVGNQLPFYPKYTATGSVTYERSIGAFEGFVRGDIFYTSRQYETESNLAWTPDATLVNIRLGVERDFYRIELFGTNIFNNKTPTSLARLAYNQYRPNGTSYNTSSITVSLPDPASYGIRTRIRF